MTPVANPSAQTLGYSLPSPTLAEGKKAKPEQQVPSLVSTTVVGTPRGIPDTKRHTTWPRGNKTQYNIVFPLWTRSQAGVPTSTITASSNSSPVTREVKRLGFKSLAEIRGSEQQARVGW